MSFSSEFAKLILKFMCMCEKRIAKTVLKGIKGNAYYKTIE